MFTIKKGKREKGSWDVSVSLSEKKLETSIFVRLREQETIRLIPAEVDKTVL